MHFLSSEYLCKFVFMVRLIPNHVHLVKRQNIYFPFCLSNHNLTWDLKGREAPFVKASSSVSENSGAQIKCLTTYIITNIWKPAEYFLITILQEKNYISLSIVDKRPLSPIHQKADAHKTDNWVHSHAVLALGFTIFSKRKETGEHLPGIIEEIAWLR